jgi:hypothetical protein
MSNAGLIEDVDAGQRGGWRESDVVGTGNNVDTRGCQAATIAGSE